MEFSEMNFPLQFLTTHEIRNIFYRQVIPIIRKDVQNGHALWTCKMNMEQEAWTSSMDMQHDMSMGMTHGKEA
jgi:hypothetical protein